MGCGCKENPCTGKPKCSCEVKDLATDCVLYGGEDLSCSGITSGKPLTEVLIALDKFICEKFATVINYLTLVNVGGGAEVYKGINGIGQKEFRTLVSGTPTLLDVEENLNTLEINPGTPELRQNLNADILEFIVTTLAGENIFGQVDLSKYTKDTFIQGATFNPTNFKLTITRNNQEPAIEVDLGFLNNHVESGAYNNNNISLVLTDGSEVDIDINNLVNEILQAQVQSDVLETDVNSKAFIKNKNPEKTITLGQSQAYIVSNSDNNYVIEIDNGLNDVIINLIDITETSNFFVGFIQKGAGKVSFINYDEVPFGFIPEIFGKGHIAAVQVIANTKYINGTLKSS